MYAEEKARAIRELADERGYDLAACYAYSDSVTDVPMLEVVGHAFAVNPDKELRKVAAERGWPVLVFTRPVDAAQSGSACQARRRRARCRRRPHRRRPALGRRPPPSGPGVRALVVPQGRQLNPHFSG